MDNALSLHQLNSLVRGLIHAELPDQYWVAAEMSDVRANQNGHCYLEFVEKDTQGRNVVAKARGMIWASTFYMLKTYFESATQQPFASGLKVLVKVSVDFHELYGYSLTVHDIDPSYTLGDQAMNRAAILKQLEEDGVLELNKELELPQPTNRIAIISSPTAAGYEDFCNQLENNSLGVVFYTKLFSAIMQGDKAEDSIIAALEKIYDNQDAFDAVVIIRGGGATSDLSCFDSYLLAASCAQFPLPIITGIGHERDNTVLDIVAHTRAKTPTAVAEFLVDKMGEAIFELETCQQLLAANVNALMQSELLKLNTYQTQTVYMLKAWNENQKAILTQSSVLLRRVTQTAFRQESTLLSSFEKILELVSPQNVLNRGYSITLKNGKAVKNASELKSGDEVKILFADGDVESTIGKRK